MDKTSSSADVEANVTADGDKNSSVMIGRDPAVPGEVVSASDRTIFGQINLYMAKYQVEARGIERVSEEDRIDTAVSNAATVWLSSNMTVSTFALGGLATPVFGLGFVEAVLTIIFVNTLGVTAVGFYSTLGPKFGLRQMVLGRYWFGYHPVKIFAILNSIAAICWSAVNSIVGAQLFYAVSSDIPGWAGIIIVASGTGIITLFGYKSVHRYQKWAWIPVCIIFLIVTGEFARSGNFRNVEMRTGRSAAASVLSFAAAVFGSSTGWSTYAADYSVYMPPTTSRKKIFAWTFAGLIFPLFSVQILGAAVGTATTGSEAFADAYGDAGIGGLLGAVLFPRLGRFAQVCIVVLALGVIANNCPNQYSISLNLQILSAKTQLVPRFLWTTISVIVFAGLAIGGYSQFESFLRNFMLVMGYWVSIYESISLMEHLIFLKGVNGYDIENWQNPRTLPLGIAACVGFLFGVLGAVLGMAQAWFRGPIGRLVGDIGFELAFAFGAIAYIPSRMLEKRIFQR